MQENIASYKSEEVPNGFWGWFFSRKYMNTKFWFLGMLPWLFFIPVQPSIPEKSEIQSITGNVRIIEAEPGSQSVTTFQVNDEVLHCGFSPLGGMHACGSLKDVLKPEVPVQASYFPMRTYYGKSANLLNSLEQNGREIVSPERLQEARMRFFEGQWQTATFMAIGWFLFGVLVIVTDIKNAKSLSSPSSANIQDNTRSSTGSGKENKEGRSLLTKWIFSSQHRFTKASFLILIPLLLYFPAEPQMPLPEDLQESTGIPQLTQSKKGKEWVFSLGGNTYHCVFSNHEGNNGCEFLEKYLPDVPATITYFPMKTRVGESAMMLNSLSVAGTTVVNSETFQNKRVTRYFDEKERYKFNFVFFLIFLFFIWKLESKDPDEGVEAVQTQRTFSQRWQAFKILVKPYKNTLGFVIFSCQLFLVFSPSEPRLPEKGELFHLKGMGEFRFVNIKGVTGYDFYIDGAELWCAGGSHCREFEVRMDFDKPFHATYYMQTLNTGFNLRYLYSLEQEGRLLISPDELYRLHLEYFHRDSWIMYYSLAGISLMVIWAGWMMDGPERKKKHLIKKGE